MQAEAGADQVLDLDGVRHGVGEDEEAVPDHGLIVVSERGEAHGSAPVLQGLGRRRGVNAGQALGGGGGSGGREKGGGDEGGGGGEKPHALRKSSIRRPRI